MLMSWAGLKVSHAIMSAVSDMKAPANAAVNQAGAMGNRFVNMAMNHLKAAMTSAKKH